MEVRERDALALADTDTLRAAGLEVDDDFVDCVNPGARWREVIQSRQAHERQRRAVRALGELTRDDVRALLEALADE